VSLLIGSFVLIKDAVYDTAQAGRMQMQCLPAFFLSGKAARAILYIYYETRHFIDCQRSEEMNPKHTLNEYADALARAGLLTASTLTPAAEGTVIDCLSY